MSSELLTDEVWRHLDPRAARLDHRSRRALLLAVLGAVLAATFVVLAQLSGLLNSQLDVRNSGGEVTIGSMQVKEDFVLRNTGWIDEHVLAVDVTTPGFRMVRATGVGSTIPPSGLRSIAVHIRVTDCARVSRSMQVPIQLRLHRFWGEKTLTVDSDAGDFPWRACHRR